MIRGIKISLTRDEQDLAIFAGNDIRRRRIASGSVHRWNRQNDYALNDPISWVGAEIVSGNIIGRKWVYRTEPDSDGDLGPKEQVRWTKHVHGHLILHPEDKSDHKFIFVTGEFPHYEVKGWVFGFEGKLKELWGEFKPGYGRPCFKVPQESLRKMGTWNQPEAAHSQIAR